MRTCYNEVQIYLNSNTFMRILKQLNILEIRINDFNAFDVYRADSTIIYLRLSTRWLFFR